jgi:hypothetical protein
MHLMHAEWAIQYEDGSIHTVDAEVIFDGLRRLKITWDGRAAGSWVVFLLIGKLKSFQRDGHAFECRVVRGIGSLADLALFMDGVEVPEGYVKGKPILVKELSVEEFEETVAVETFPLDNRHGDAEIVAEHEVSHESTHELNVNHKVQVDVTIGEIIAAVTAEFFRETGYKIGEKVLKTYSLTFRAGPGKFVRHKIEWKRRVRSVERLYSYELSRTVRRKGELSGDKLVSIGTVDRKIPYEIKYDLSYAVTAERNADGT